MGNGITIFTIPRAFKGDVGIRQANAVNSWIYSDYDVILCGDDPGVVEFAQQVGARSLPDVARNEWNTPLVNDVFTKVQALLDEQLIIFVNTDIILDETLADVMKTTGNQFDKFLVVGHRHDVIIEDENNETNGEFDFSDGWQKRMRTLVTDRNIHSPFGLDYFGFRATLWPPDAIPPVAVGRTRWDNYLYSSAHYLGAVLVDATPVVAALHQIHGYEHIPEKEVNGRWTNNEEIKRNRTLLGIPSLHIGHASWLYTSKGLVKK